MKRLKDVKKDIERFYDVMEPLYDKILVFLIQLPPSLQIVWSQQDILITPPVVTTDFVYLKLIGDRNINEKDFGKINKDRTKEMEIWSKILEDDDRKVKDLNLAIITANNHYAGFGPMTAKLFAEMMNLKDHIRPFPILDYKISSQEISTSEKENYRIYKQRYSKPRQTDISEFFK
jgi:uncharacterized protein YecE (DUF72 family)